MNRVPIELMKFAHELADAAGEQIRPQFRKAAVVQSKDSHTEYPDVVTEADLNAEKAMRALIEERYPAHGILGEEFGSTRLESDWVWVLDPVDGTRDFATGTLTWGTLIGLCFRSTPVLGVIDQPIAGDRWLGAHGHPTVYNGEPVVFTHDGDVPSTLAASRCVVSGAGFGALRDAGYIAAATALVAAVTTTSFTVNAYAYGLLALGAIELAFEAPDAQAYDICAVIPVIEGVGGSVCHTGRHPDEPRGARFDEIDLHDTEKCYSSLVCLGPEGGPLQTEALALITAHGYQEGGSSVGAKL